MFRYIVYNDFGKSMLKSTGSLGDPKIAHCGPPRSRSSLRISEVAKVPTPAFCEAVEMCPAAGNIFYLIIKGGMGPRAYMALTDFIGV